VTVGAVTSSRRVGARASGRLLYTGEKLRRAGTHRGEARGAAGFARKGEHGRVTSGNVVNPMVGSALQYTYTAGKEQADEVVGDHEVGTREELAALLRRRVVTVRRRGSPGVDSPVFETTEGRSLDNPKRGSPSGSSGSRTRVASGKPA